jgi:O-antigen/teichoic acid export membrane protein
LVNAASIIQKQLAGPIARATVQTSGVLAARLLVQGGTLLVLARLLGSAQFAALASLSALAVFLGAMAPFGTHLVMVRDLSRDPGRRNSLLPVVLGTTTFCGAALLLVYVGVYFLLLRHLSIDVVTVLFIGVAELLAQPLLTISATERLAAGRVARSQLLRMLPLPLQLTTATYLWLAGTPDPLAAYAVGHVASALVALAISLLLQAEQWPVPQRWRLPDRSGWKDNTGFALLALTGSGPTELDKTLSARLLPLETAGIYAAASRITVALVVPISSMMMAALPRLFQESNNGPLQRRLLYRIFVSSLAYGLVGAASLWLLAPVVDRLFGPAFAGLSLTIRWFSLVVPGLCLRLAAVNILMTIGCPWIRISIEVIGIAMMISCALVFTADGAGRGLVVAVICAETAMALLGWTWILSRRSRSADAR